MKLTLLGAVVTAGLLLASPAVADLYLHDTLDLSNSNYFPQPLFDNASLYGTNPSAVTTDGSSIWLAGYNGGAGVATGIVRIDDPWGSASATFVNSLAGTPSQRGYSGLAYHTTAGAVLAAYDNGGASIDGITGWNGVTNASLWAKNARGGSGVGDDPGFGGNGIGAGWTTFGSGRRALQDATTGADIYTTGDGMIINGAGTGTFWRDMDFAPNGDIWLREGNNVIMAVRTAANGVNTAALVVDAVEADSVNGQNLSYMNGMPGGDIIVYNDRAGGAPGQAWGDIVKLINPDGAPAAHQFLDGLGGALPGAFGEGAAFYDFEWDAANEALIVSDFTNRAVYRFLTVPVPEPASLVALALGGLLALRRR